MTVEEIDGFFCALAIEPDRTKAREWMPAIFGSWEKSPFQSNEQRIKVGELIIRMWNTIVDRLEAGYPHRLLLQPSEKPRGANMGERVYSGDASARIGMDRPPQER
jgi:yecA family protein